MWTNYNPTDPQTKAMLAKVRKTLKRLGRRNRKRLRAMKALGRLLFQGEAAGGDGTGYPSDAPGCPRIDDLRKTDP